MTGGKFMVIYGALGQGGGGKPLTPAEVGYLTQQLPPNQGQFQVKFVGTNVAQQSLMGDLIAASHLGASRTYTITDGKIVTELEGMPIATAVYKLGDKYYPARSNEFGYANYEIVPAVTQVSPLGVAPESATK